MAVSESKRCSRCHQEKPVAEFRKQRRVCIRCYRAYQKQQRDADPEKHHAFYASWRKRNAAYHAERNNKWYHAHKAVVAESTKVYRERNAEKLAEGKRLYHEKNAETVRAKVRSWVKANPLKRLAQVEKRRSLKISLPSDWTDTDIRFALSYWGDSCAVCRVPFGLIASPQWDHWIPLSNPACPGTVPGNMVPLCLFCNATKQDRNAEKWLNERFKPKAADILRRVAGFLIAAVYRRQRP